MTKPAGDPSGMPRPGGMPDYLKEAFLFRWNLLLSAGVSPRRR